jgi:murein L,D-transpeptidase YcbB/YkuD
VRVQNVRDLVTWLLRDTPGWDRQRFEHDIKTVENESVPLAVPVPVYFVYITAWASPGNVVHFRDDIYGRDGAGELQMSNAL